MSNKNSVIKIATIALFIIFFALFYYFLTFKRTAVPLVETPLTYKSLVPGQASEDEVIQKLGDPKEKTETAEGVFLKYSSRSLTRDDTVLIKDGKVYLIKEVVTLENPKNASYFKSVFNEPQITLYGREAAAYIFLFAYPEKGIAYLANAEKGDVFEVWYFSPTDITGFKESIAQGYQDSPQESQ